MCHSGRARNFFNNSFAYIPEFPESTEFPSAWMGVAAGLDFRGQAVESAATEQVSSPRLFFSLTPDRGRV
jgi:hypothetical protein